ncbi:hypothetical protein [Modestobacter altitudinis]|uniref:hypothetical protein n=1 Tax=Modestobacter altitudinis TaxID=2213158 RepID=UPI00110CC7FD|nr:hypothetical protein [Modestobacter altitudinis]
MAEQGRRTSHTAVRRTPRKAARRASRNGGLTRWLTPVLAVAAGGLFAASQLTPVLVELTASSTIADEGATSGGSSAVSLGDGLMSWSTGPVAGDSNGATVTDGDAGGGLVVPQPPRPGGITLQPWAARGVAPTLTPLEPACGGYSTPERITPGVVAGTGSATVTWMSDARGEVQSYQVSAVDQQPVSGVQPAPLTATAAQPEGCQQVSATVTGLVSGQYYVFWLEEQVVSATTGRTRLDQVGSSAPVLVG